MSTPGHGVTPTFWGAGAVKAPTGAVKAAAGRTAGKVTSELLAEYAAALGIHPFDENYYTQQGLLIETKVKVPRGGKSISLEDTQKDWGIVPGVADQLPG